VAKAFLDHWRSIRRSRRDLAKQHRDCFLAGSSTARLSLARRFYARDHVRHLADLTSAEVLTALAPWLDHAVRYAFETRRNNAERRSFLNELPVAEYVTIIHFHGDHDWRVDPYPHEQGPYDDLYERVLAGRSSGGVIRLYKSTGEAFMRSEVRSVWAAMKNELLLGAESAGDETPWALHDNGRDFWVPDMELFQNEDSSRVVVVEVNEYDQLSCAVARARVLVGTQAEI